jgi:hypothetical protein
MLSHLVAAERVSQHTKSQKPVEFKKIQTLSVKPTGQSVAQTVDHGVRPQGFEEIVQQHSERYAKQIGRVTYEDKPIAVHGV